jgi:hypothetical protein
MSAAHDPVNPFRHLHAAVLCLSLGPRIASVTQLDSGPFLKHTQRVNLIPPQLRPHVSCALLG